ncbi:MAG TPA: hypothetical protein VGC77_08840 [Rhodopseudomonas sp.]|uniref:hypothetical protein n=1 Tax=Rhodopseudomonas sp. TaxID=1078 RepID=UPI002ED79380
MLLVALGSAAMAQSGIGTAPADNRSGSPALSSDQKAVVPAPVGHRQPRLDPSLPDPNTRDPADVALDRQLRSICRGC